jgi:hypothetical protein
LKSLTADFFSNLPKNGTEMPISALQCRFRHLSALPIATLKKLAQLMAIAMRTTNFRLLRQRKAQAWPSSCVAPEG